MTRTCCSSAPEGRLHPRRRRGPRVVVRSRPALRGLADPRPQWDPSTGSIYAGGGSPWYGPAVFRSDDLGETWTHSSEGLTYGDDGPKIPTVWNVTAGPRLDLRRRRAGRACSGATTAARPGRHVAGLRDHPSRPGWQPGAGGLICHTIVPHPTDAARMWVAISAVGTFATEDGGATWEARNRGVVDCNSPDPHPETGQCVHKLVMAAGEPDRLYQQNHCGVYRSPDAGRELGGHQRRACRPSSGSSWAPIRATRRPAG